MLSTIGERIKERRLELGMTLAELGYRVGAGASTVRKWEVGFIKTLKNDKIQKLAAALSVHPAYLMGWINAPKPARFEKPLTQEFSSKEEVELLRIYKELSGKWRVKLLAFATELEEKSASE